MTLSFIMTMDNEHCQFDYYYHYYYYYYYYDYIISASATATTTAFCHSTMSNVCLVMMVLTYCSW